MNQSNKTLNALVLASLATLAAGSTTTFAATEMAAGYEVAAMEASCGADKQKTENTDKAKEGKCGEGKCGEGKCGGDKAAAADGKAKEGKCGEGKCGGDKKDAAAKGKEGKCGGAH